MIFLQNSTLCPGVAMVTRKELYQILHYPLSPSHFLKVQLFALIDLFIEPVNITFNSVCNLYMYSFFI